MIYRLPDSTCECSECGSQDVKHDIDNIGRSYRTCKKCGHSDKREDKPICWTSNSAGKPTVTKF